MTRTTLLCVTSTYSHKTRAAQENNVQCKLMVTPPPNQVFLFCPHVFMAQAEFLPGFISLHAWGHHRRGIASATVDTIHTLYIAMHCPVPVGGHQVTVSAFVFCYWADLPNNNQLVVCTNHHPWEEPISLFSLPSPFTRWLAAVRSKINLGAAGISLLQQQ